MQKRGGITRYFMELAKHLALTGGARVEIRAPVFVSEQLQSLKMHGVQVTGLGLPAFPGVTALGRAISSVYPHRQPVDIAHATWYPMSRPRGARKFVVTVYDMIAELYPEQVTGAKKQAYRKKAAVAAADLVFCISENTRRDVIEHLGINEEKIVVTPLASALGEVSPADYFNDVPYILYVGQRGGYKNFRALCEAFISSFVLRREFQLICFGGAPFDFDEKELMSALSKAGRGSVKHMAGDDALLASLYRNASLYVCPSLYEGFGLPVLEAMSCECPVLGAPLGSIPEVGGDAIAYLAEAHSETIKQDIETLIFDTSRIEMMKRAGLMRSRDFSWAQTAAISLAGYKSVLER